MNDLRLRHENLLLIMLPITSMFVVLAMDTKMNPELKAGGIFGIILLNIVVFYLYEQLASAYEKEMEQYLLSQKLRQYENQLELMRESVKRIRSIRHDIKNHIIVVKQLFGGLGQNFMNPALGARCFLLICFAGKMTYFVYDGVTGPTPLAELKAGETVNTLSMLLGNIRGTIGETSVVAIMIGAMFLILMGVIDLRIPGTYIVTFVIFITLFGGHGFDPQYITAHLCGGGLMLGAWFMATDYVTSPITSKGKILFGICLGCLTGLFRLFGGSAEGVSYAIIISNLLVPLIEKVTLPKPFGKGGEK